MIWRDGVIPYFIGTRERQRGQVHSWIFRVQVEGTESDFPACTTDHFKGSKCFCVRSMKAEHFCWPDPMISGQAQNMMTAQLMTTRERLLKFMQEFFIKDKNNFAGWYAILLTTEPSLWFPFLNLSSIPISSSSANKTNHMQNKLPLKQCDLYWMMNKLCILYKVSETYINFVYYTKLACHESSLIQEAQNHGIGLLGLSGNSINEIFQYHYLYCFDLYTILKC